MTTRRRQKQKQKQKPKVSLSPLQRKRLLRISCVIIVGLMIWIVFAPGRGLYHLRQQKKNLASLKAEQKELIQQNSDMKIDIERLQNDTDYLEQVAREKHGMLKDNEMVFDFGKKQNKKK